MNEKSFHISLETSRFVFAQSPYFSSRVRKSNLDCAQEPEHAPNFSPRVLDIAENYAGLAIAETLLDHMLGYCQRQELANKILTVIIPKYERLVPLEFRACLTIQTDELKKRCEKELEILCNSDKS